MRLGIFGGVFNPPHLGHLILAQEAQNQLELERVLFVPLGHASHRQIDPDPGPDERFVMCERAVAGDDRFEVSRIEIDRGGSSYTVDTLRALHERSPEDELFVLMGGDQGAALRAWHEPTEIVSLATAAIAERDEWRQEEILERLAGLGSEGRVTFFDMPRIEISSTQIRRRLREGRPIRYLVPEPVAAHIARERLYSTRTAVSAE